MDDQISSLASPLVMGIDFQAAGSWTSNVNTQFSFLMKPIFFFIWNLFLPSSLTPIKYVLARIQL